MPDTLAKAIGVWFDHLALPDSTKRGWPAIAIGIARLSSLRSTTHQCLGGSLRICLQLGHIFIIQIRHGTCGK
jgi:hypothetical protein